MLDGVEARYGDLLTVEERGFLTGFRALSRDARCLWVRLLSRKGPIFRCDRLHYREIGSPEDAADELCGGAFADPCTNEEAVRLLPLLRRDELAETARELGIGRRFSRRGEIETALFDEVEAESLGDLLQARYRFLRLRHLRAARALRLLFFGNLRQDWSEFVLTDLELWRYETYSLRGDLRLFPERRAVDDVLSAHDGRALVRRCLEDRDLVAAWTVARQLVDRDEAWHPLADPTVAGTVAAVGRELEREGDLERALDLYAAIDEPPARERRVRVLARMDRLPEALAVCRRIEDDSRDEGERSFAPRFRHRLERRLGRVPPTYRHRRPRRRLRLPREAGRAPEAAALSELERHGRQGVHGENWLWRALFGLVFWDVIFAPVVGAFEHAFQTGPLDLWSSSFRPRRADLVEARLGELRAGAWTPARIDERWRQKEGLRNALVAWTPDVRRAVGLAIETVPGTDLAHVFDRLSRDPGRYRRGFPDLFVVDAAGAYELLEVKAPGDQLRAEQRGWLDYLGSGGIPAHLLTLEWR